MAGERAEQLDVLFRAVDTLPVVMADGGDLEQPAGLDVGPVIGQFPRPRPSFAGRLSLADLVVDLLKLLEERIAARGKYLSGPPDGQVAAGVQRLPGPLVPDGGINPVPGRGRVDQAGRLVRAPPPLHELQPTGQRT